MDVTINISMKSNRMNYKVFYIFIIKSCIKRRSHLVNEQELHIREINIYTNVYFLL